MSYKISALFFILWGMLAMITTIVELESSPGDVAGSTSDFQTFANTVANPEQVSIDQATVGGSTNPISGTWQFAKQSGQWLAFMARSMMLQSPIWEGWTQPIRYGIMLISIPYLFHVTIQMAGLASNFLGGIFGRVTP